MSQLKFARLVGTSRQMLDKWEKGDCKPGIDSLLKIINACRVPVCYFFTENDDIQNLLAEQILVEKQVNRRKKKLSHREDI